MTTQGTPNASSSGEFRILGERAVHRLGFGAMRITGKGIWGPPKDRDEALRVLRRLPALGVNFVDTADAYGPFVSEDLLREALHPYDGVVVATKGGLTRHGPDSWAPLGRPEYLRQCALMSMRRLGVDRIELWQLHRIDPKVPREEQLDCIAQMRKEGLFHYVGLSEVNVEEVEAARKHFPVATVQNRYNLVDRQSEDVLAYCERHGIGFIPWFPLGAGSLAGPASALAKVAARLGVTPGQVALAWTLKRSKVMLPIPGTSKVDHLEQNVAAAAVKLTDEDFAELDAQGRGKA
ncbi:MAG TPA: aldo/keto reductase [Polyangiaceae bacterium]|jgi:aryl-alcohol dehydrogenase-like predicted oxidoreductase